MIVNFHGKTVGIELVVLAQALAVSAKQLGMHVLGADLYPNMSLVNETSTLLMSMSADDELWSCSALFHSRFLE